MHSRSFEFHVLTQILQRFYLWIMWRYIQDEPLLAAVQDVGGPQKGPCVGQVIGCHPLRQREGWALDGPVVTLRISWLRAGPVASLRTPRRGPNVGFPFAGE